MGGTDGPERGTGQVHSHLGTRPGWQSDASDTESGRSRRDLHSSPERARRLAEESASRIRGRAGRLLEEGRGRLESSGAVKAIQENPMIAVGAAFAIGFLLAGRSDPSTGFGKKKQQLRGAVVGAAAAAIAQGARDLIESEGGIAGLLGGLFSTQPLMDLDDEEEEYEGHDEGDEEYDPDDEL